MPVYVHKKFDINLQHDVLYLHQRDIYFIVR